jgi:hypothetical protein
MISRSVVEEMSSRDGKDGKDGREGVEEER